MSGDKSASILLVTWRHPMLITQTLYTSTHGSSTVGVKICGIISMWIVVVEQHKQDNFEKYPFLHSATRIGGNFHIPIKQQGFLFEFQTLFQNKAFNRSIHPDLCRHMASQGVNNVLKATHIPGTCSNPSRNNDIRGIPNNNPPIDPAWFLLLNDTKGVTIYIHRHIAYWIHIRLLCAIILFHVFEKH